MTQINQRLSHGQLRVESHALEYLLRSYLEDSEFIGKATTGLIIYFADSHEIKSFIDPDDDATMTGFVLTAERAILSNTREPGLDFRLKNDLVLRQLLFEQGVQVGLLPSHGEEVDEEIAFKQLLAATTKIKLLEDAKDEWTRIRSEPETRRLLALAAAEESRDGAGRQKIIAFFRHAAPTLMALLRPGPDSPQKRIEALVKDSTLVRLSDLSWEAFGFNEAAGKRLRSVRPSETSLQKWRHYLSKVPERKHNSIRSNRIDGEALAYLQALNDELEAIPAPRVKARLVTRAMTLINAARKATPRIEFLRHPRLLALNRSVASGPTADREAANALVVNLKTYQARLRSGDASRSAFEDRALTPVVESLVQAWHKFEQSRIAVDFRAELEANEPLFDDDASDFQELINWFKRDHDMLSLVRTDLLGTIGRFGEATFALGREEHDAKVQAITVEVKSSHRTRIYPMVVGAPGPVDFHGLPRTRQERVHDIEGLTSQLQSNSPERYLSWSLLCACEGRWTLAGIYAESAAAIGSLIKEHTSLAEAHLLGAQIQRLSGNIGGEQKPADAIRRFSRTERELRAGRLALDARALRERAAQLLEFKLALLPRDEGLPPLRRGIELIHQALDVYEGDIFVQSRALELGLCYFLAARGNTDLWPDLSEADYAVLQNWHKKLCQVQSNQRQMLMMDEIPRHVRAMEIIGFQLVDQNHSADVESDPEYHFIRGRSENDLSIPLILRHNVSELREQLSKCKDLTTKLICDELDRIVHRLYADRPRDLIYAPVWASYDADRILGMIRGGIGKELTVQAYGLLRDVAGASLRRGIQLEDRAPLEEAARLFGEAREFLSVDSESGYDATSDVMFHLRMEHCYSRLLLSCIASSDDKPELLEALEADYREIAADFPKASIPHFRLDVVLTDLGREEEAFAALTDARRLVDGDGFLQTPNHWVRSTMERRLTSRLIRGAEAKVDELAKPESQADRTATLKLLLDAFKVLFVGWTSRESPEEDYLRELEARRRINNIVYIACLILKLDPDGVNLRELGFGREQLKPMIGRLQDGPISRMTELSLVHTVGYASAVMDDMKTAACAGRRLVELIIERGEDPRDERVARALADAVRWQGTPSN